MAQKESVIVKIQEMWPAPPEPTPHGRSVPLRIFPSVKAPQVPNSDPMTWFQALEWGWILKSQSSYLQLAKE